jgi:methylphosphotriester-DNA--protein-cysteine methyltransferase
MRDHPRMILREKMIRHVAIVDTRLLQMIAAGKITLAGNAKLKIYGLLNCRSGRRMRRENRVFFSNEDAALSHGFRPCGACLKPAYNAFKAAQKNPSKTSQSFCTAINSGQ